MLWILTVESEHLMYLNLLKLSHECRFVIDRQLLYTALRYRPKSTPHLFPTPQPLSLFSIGADSISPQELLDTHHIGSSALADPVGTHLTVGLPDRHQLKLSRGRIKAIGLLRLGEDVNTYFPTNNIVITLSRCSILTIDPIYTSNKSHLLRSHLTLRFAGQLPQR